MEPASPPDELDDVFAVVLGSLCVAAVAALTGAYCVSTIIPTEFDAGVSSAPLDEIELTSGTLILSESNVEIQLVLATHWSHVAVVMEGERGEEPVCVDLTPTSRTVQAQPARAYIARELQNGTHRVAVRQLVGAPNPTRDLRGFFARVRHAATYEHSYWKPAFHRITRLLDVPPVRRGSYFCSNVIADALRVAGVLAVSADEARNMLPPDFAAACLPTMPDYAYEPMLLVRGRLPRAPQQPQAPKQARAERGAERVEEGERDEQLLQPRLGRREPGRAEVGDDAHARRDAPAAVEQEEDLGGDGEGAADGDDGAHDPPAERRVDEEDEAEPAEQGAAHADGRDVQQPGHRALAAAESTISEEEGAGDRVGFRRPHRDGVVRRGGGDSRDDDANGGGRVLPAGRQ